ncbi:MAG: HAMP domain-containing sensor histidine kinase [Chloroflexota bacterium]
MTTRQGIIDHLAISEIITQRSDWKQALDEVISLVYSVFIFDNLALFIKDEVEESSSEVVYARAVGRGKSAGPDSAWGLDVAAQVLEKNDLVIEEPEKTSQHSDRLKNTYLLGLPIRTTSGLYGAMVFIRFGGPSYSKEDIVTAKFIAFQFAGLFQRKKLLKDIQTLEEIRNLLALQDDFIATMSHELRTPLGFIKGYTTTLLRQDTTWDENTQREFLTIIDEEADHLSTLIENVLESARLQSNTLPMKFQPARIDSLIIETAARAQARTPGLLVNFDFPEKPILRIDTVRLAQVLNNLFTNAAKYAPGAPINISITKNANFYQIRFSDKGPGIPAEHIPNLFKRFFRVPGQGGNGSGLGLFICNKIIDAHNGKISVESEPGLGTTFVIELPIGPAILAEGDLNVH